MVMEAISTAASTTAGDQNATILDFDCIYSHDIQRKRQKRWHDGFLRFHTFNRRVMVYDVPRNFIGDTHLRDAETLQDGDELQLDRGVLVEVGESRGISKQDVTPLFEKKRSQAQHAEPGQKPPPQQSHSSPPRSSLLLKPKPLNVVLGPRRGVQGRAMLSKQSPHDSTKRLGVTVQEREDIRSTKRPRLEESRETPAASKRNTEQHLGIRKASSLVPTSHATAPIDSKEKRRTKEQPDPRNSSELEPTQERHRAPKVRPVGATRTENADSPQESTNKQLTDSGKDRITSKLKVSATKRPKLMYTAGATSTSKSAYGLEHQDSSLPKRRAPLRVSAMDQSSSPTSGNFTVMDFPMTQDLLAEPSPMQPAKTLEELDQELLDSSPPLPRPPSAPKAMPLSKSVSEPTLKHAPPSEKPPVSKEVPPAADPNLLRPSPSVSKPESASTAALEQNLASDLHCPDPPPLPTVSKPNTSQPLARLLQPAGLSRATAHSLHQNRASLKKPVSDSTGAQSTSAVTSKEAQDAAAAPILPTAATSDSSRAATTAAPPPPLPPTVSVEPDIGPWSRTAFDLFGFQVPVGAKDHEIRLLKKNVTAIRGSVRGMMREYCD